MENKFTVLHSIGGAIFAIFGVFAIIEYINGKELIEVLKTLGIGLSIPIITSSITFFILRKKHDDNENRVQ